MRDDDRRKRPLMAPVGLACASFLLAPGSCLLWAVAWLAIGRPAAAVCAGVAIASNFTGLMLSPFAFAGCARWHAIVRDWRYVVGMGAGAAAFGMNFVLCLLTAAGFVLNSYRPQF